eukprot:CAMPEP_0171260556 /NCGR_PEP_ID=MMETSP0790-20130122/55514_1 /TAXON_ID=2925 /ORGANISM="Alexandrium catenella, Strain OF101" /LENGTH=68 /DNA_ID=CAMNT_0011728885 /DNA_START=54 /DNA_END=257 /DNA_ORIENTATION=+
MDRWNSTKGIPTVSNSAKSEQSISASGAELLPVDRLSCFQHSCWKTRWKKKSSIGSTAGTNSGGHDAG